MKDEDSTVRSYAASALGNQTALSESTILALVTILKDGDSMARHTALNTLGLPRLCLLLIEFSEDDLFEFYLNALFSYCCSRPFSIFINDSRLNFYTSQGFGQSEILDVSIISRIKSAIQRAQNSLGM